MISPWLEWPIKREILPPCMIRKMNYPFVIFLEDLELSQPLQYGRACMAAKIIKRVLYSYINPMDSIFNVKPAKVCGFQRRDWVLLML